MTALRVPGKTSPLHVTRRPERFVSDDRRVITRLFLPGDEARVRAVIDRVLHLDEEQVRVLLGRVYRDFRARHRNLEEVFQTHFDAAKGLVHNPDQLSRDRQLLIGAYFTMEYSFESAALFNPSIVPHPDQDNLPEGSVRFLMSLRATGEGHVSSIVFRTGVIGPDGAIHFNPAARFAHSPRPIQDKIYDKRLVFLKLIEMGAYNEEAQRVLDGLEDEFTFDHLNRAIDIVRSDMDNPEAFNETANNILWLARSNYHLRMGTDCDPSEIVIFPASENESQGIEDVRLVRFINDDGSATYYGTYTAYNGFRILPQLLETHTFTILRIHTLNGRYAQNKGMALFPRKVGGWYMMISRLDGENLYLMRSDNVYFWNEAAKLQSPRFPWEFVQIGNNGSPIETDAGWLLLTHGVGPVRQYCIGASLLDKNDPTRVIGQLKDPLIVPNDEERDGYVPNVVYSCGAMVHGEQLIIPYAVSDSATTFASVPLNQVLANMI